MAQKEKGKELRTSPAGPSSVICEYRGAFSKCLHDRYRLFLVFAVVNDNDDIKFKSNPCCRKLDVLYILFQSRGYERERSYPAFLSL